VINRNENRKQQIDEFIKAIRAFSDEFRNALGRIGNLFRPTKVLEYDETEEYKAALGFFQSFDTPVSTPETKLILPIGDDTPKELPTPVDYAPVVDYAKTLLERMEHTEKLLDEKADSIVKHLGGGAALITFGVFFSFKAESSRACLIGFLGLLSTLPVLYCTVRAIRYAIAGRMPQSNATLLGVDYAVKIAEHYKEKDKVEINLWLLLHPICQAYLHRNKYKAELVKKAHEYYLRALRWLFLPIATILITLLVFHLKGDVKVPPQSVNITAKENKLSQD
jgi:hypothetical protein